MSDQQQQHLENTIALLGAMADGCTDDQYARSRLASARHDLAQHLAAERWNAWTASHTAASRRRHFTARHKSRKGATHA